MNKAMIVDDERDARALIREYLEAIPGFEIIGEAENSWDAISIINTLEPDLVFLDIQMPGISGLQLISKLIHRPQIIITTAFDRYALRAFDLDAIDYLLKPYTMERFSRAISKFKTARLNYPHDKLPAETSDRCPSIILVESGKKMINLDVAEIMYMQADKDYTWIHTDGQSYLSNFGISLLAQRMDKDLFLRIHRSTIVNLKFVKEVYREDGTVRLILKNDKSLNVSRSYLEELRRYFF